VLVSVLHEQYIELGKRSGNGFALITDDVCPIIDDYFCELQDDVFAFHLNLNIHIEISNDNEVKVLN
jgi:hypothetical protein